MTVSAGDGLALQLMPGRRAPSGALGTRHHRCMCWLPSAHCLQHSSFLKTYAFYMTAHACTFQHVT